MSQFKKPKSFDYNLIVIGAGSAGLVTAYIAAAVKAKVALIEKNKMGGDCLNYGCVPSKALIRSAKIMHYANRAKEFGFKSAKIEFDFAEVMERVQRVIKEIEPHDSVERYTDLGVECFQGGAMIKSPYEVGVNGKTFTTKAIVIATGARPFIPDVEGINLVDAKHSENIWNIRTQPKHLVVLGGGPIGAELAQAFQRLGSKVTIIERGPRIMGREDDDVSDIIMKRFKNEGVELLTNHTLKSFGKDGEQKYLIAETDKGETRIEFDEVLLALGRRANTKGFGLENLDIELTKQGTIKADDYLATNYPNIYVCGDVAGPYQFTHTASHQAYYAAVNGLFGFLTKNIPFTKAFKVNYDVIPWATYTDPEVATVGLTEKTAKEKGVAYDLTTYGVDDLDRAIAEEEADGIVKVLTEPGTDRIIGATIVSHHASDMIVEFIAAMKHGFGLNSILGTIHIYPTMAEANKSVAGNWKRSQTNPKTLKRLEGLHRWLRG